MKAIVNHRIFFWTLLALPAVAAILSGKDAADQLHGTGEWSARLLILALAISPLVLVARRARWTLWLQQRRRYIGVAAFAYAALHTFYYVMDMETLPAILSEITIISIWTGWLAIIAMLLMALTSNDASMRWLRAGWKKLQRLAYPAAILTLAHWLLIHDGVTAALIHFAPLALLEAYRIAHHLNRRKTPAHA
ncbi:ferric reductase-like transmembrane domain-containing protein [Pacificimonas sp. WHA3]|uniref:Ferric reductase-like transmembrane domain-containing protein n=1 Tax=Pacificimonas pallii TaxID=2827236 RepID=A0ABS6SFV2_9SPHN|nr:ferric reductase-like transmembrane domain-containing protein [Pacificimonas pallii]MBV7257260.1 ferric reductase-like transmembrane domain-containing protein [Pacificimonas pallii]